MDSNVPAQMTAPALCSLQLVGDVERATALLSPLLGTLDPEGRYVGIKRSNIVSTWNRSVLAASAWQEEFVVGNNDLAGDLGRILGSDKSTFTGMRDIIQSHTIREWLTGSDNSTAPKVYSHPNRLSSGIVSVHCEPVVNVSTCPCNAVLSESTPLTGCYTEPGRAGSSGARLTTPSTAVVLFLSEDGSYNEASTRLQSATWSFHHKIELSNTRGGRHRCKGRQEFYKSYPTLPLFSVNPVHYGDEALRVTFFTRHFDKMVDFYRIALGAEITFMRENFCLFVIESKPGLTFQLALKFSAKLNPVPSQCYYLRIMASVPMDTLRYFMESDPIITRDNDSIMADPDGNLIVVSVPPLHPVAMTVGKPQLIPAADATSGIAKMEDIVEIHADAAKCVATDKDYTGDKKTKNTGLSKSGHYSTNNGVNEGCSVGPEHRSGRNRSRRRLSQENRNAECELECMLPAQCQHQSAKDEPGTWSDKSSYDSGRHTFEASSSSETERDSCHVQDLLLTAYTMDTERQQSTHSKHKLFPNKSSKGSFSQKHKHHSKYKVDGGGPDPGLWYKQKPCVGGECQVREIAPPIYWDINEGRERIHSNSVLSRRHPKPWE